MMAISTTPSLTQCIITQEFIALVVSGLQLSLSVNQENGDVFY